MNVSRTHKLVLAAVALSLAVSFAQPAVFASPVKLSKPKPFNNRPVPVATSTPAPKKTAAVPTASAPTARWKAGTQTVTLPANSGWAHTTSMGLALRSPKTATIAVDALTPAQAKTHGLTGPTFRLRSAQAITGVSIAVDPALLNSVYGANYAARVHWATVPDATGTVTAPAKPLALTTTPSTTAFASPSAPVTSMPSSPSATTNLTSTPMLLTALSGATASDGTGSFAATSLTPASSWQVSTQTGDFAWSYPVRVPPTAAGPSPDIAFNYSSGSVDGETGSTNNQPGSIGDGWSMSGAGYIERSYLACADDTAGGGASTGDECWKSDNATLSFDGHSGTLVKDTTSGAWHLSPDDGTKVEHLTGATNGDNDGEYWLLTTTDGTKYYFGKNRITGWATGNPETQSTWTAPVYGNDSGEPCHGATFAASACTQAWRWNLDYVVDTSGNAELLRYTPETNRYAQNLTDANGTVYTRGGQLSEIDYGLRDGSVYANLATAPQRVQFTTADRCATPGATCDAAHPTNWPDVPWDQSCTAAPCTGKYEPTFFTTKRLDKIQTQVYVAGAYQNVDQYSLTQTFPVPGDGTDAALWLSKISHVGQVGGTITVPDTTFTPFGLQNRAWVADGLAPLIKMRISAITQDTGGTTAINYLPVQCVGTNLPAAAQTNTMRCFPQWWTTSSGTTRLDYFNKFPVASITSDPVTGGGADLPESWTYDYSLGTPAWRYDNSPLIPTAKRTWSVWAGYSRVRVEHGDTGTPSTVQTTDYRFFQGMDGDRAAPAGGNKTASVTATDGTSITDSLWWAGDTREQITTLGVGGSEVGGTITDPYASAVTATDGTNTARFVGTAQIRSRTALSAGGNRNTKIVTTHDAFGRTSTVDDQGDTAIATDNNCTTTTYADNTTAWIRDAQAEVKVVAKACGVAITLPTDAISDTRYSYDGAAFGIAPTVGNQTRVENVKSYTGSTPNWITRETTTYDTLGRVLVDNDALGHGTTTAYTPTGAGATTQSTETNALGWITTTNYNPAWGAETSYIDANSRRTDATYDALGRRVSVWLPGRAQATFPTSPSTSYAYTLTAGHPVAVATTSLTPTGATVTGYALYDGLGRSRQTQTPADGGGDVITDSAYNRAGQVYLTNGEYYSPTSTPSATLIVPTPQSSVPEEHDTLYDAAGRPTADILKSLGTEKWRTTTVYGGDHVDVTPPAGGTATTTYIDARGQTSSLKQYHGATPTGAADTTSYGYDGAGDMTSMTDAAGNQRTWTFDVLGRQTAAHDPNAGNTSVGYDDADRLTSTTDARSVTLAFSYDALDRKTSENLTTTGGTQLAGWTYDTLVGGKGDLTSSTRYVSGSAYVSSIAGYDSADRPTGQSVTIPAAQGALAGTYSSSQTYNVDGSVATQVLPAVAGLPLETLTSSYDSVGNLSSYIGKSDYLGPITYSALSQISETSQIFGAQELDNFNFYDDATGRLTENKAMTTAATNRVVADRTYGYNNAGSITSINDHPDAQPAD
ncbi:MAG: hypothetical protein JWN95_3659, partial [Frankiales bacterium]|nr:hypothetical protein [Frankiales bacterium]